MWGESLSRSSEMVCKAQERVSADVMAKSIRDFRESRTGVNEEAMYAALDSYERWRTGESNGS